MVPRARRVDAALAGARRGQRNSAYVSTVPVSCVLLYAKSALAWQVRPSCCARELSSLCLTAVLGETQDALPDSVGVCQLSGTVRDSSAPLSAV